MSLHAKIIERHVEEGGVMLRCEIRDDTLGALGEVEVRDGTPAEVKNALQNEAQRLQALPVGTTIDL